MENKLESGCQRKTLQFPRNQWMIYIFMETIDAYEVWDIMVMCVTNTLIQTNIPQNKNGEEM